MRISLFSDYALRVLMLAAARAPDLVTIQEVAESFGISRHHLTKVIHDLARAGFLETQRGRSGGFTLARPANRIVIGAVIRHTEAGSPLVECFDPATNRCVVTPACRLKRQLAEALSAFYAVLDKYTVADLYTSKGDVLRHLGLTASA
jgi:Rrf2 family transcriptional regulator, nitric oxide-sensitive transcriptional repressor